MKAVGRNALCTCGSGMRYKQCCGSLAATGGNPLEACFVAVAPFDISSSKKAAMDLLEQGRFVEADKLFRKILTLVPQDFDALHMLGVIAAQTGRPWEALRLILEATSVEAGDYPSLFDNLGRALTIAARASVGIEKALCPDLLESDMPLRVTRNDLPDPGDPLPLVSVVIPCYNHEPYVVEAIRSVFAQTYPHIEIIIIDDGSQDRSVEMIKGVLGESPFPVKLVVRDNKGAHVTLNEGIDLAGGGYIGILNSDDRYSPDRVDSLLRLLASTGKGWGFSGVKFIDKTGDSIQYGQDNHVDILMNGLNQLYSGNSITIGFASFNYAISTGNLFFNKALWKRLGGFSGYRYVHDWDFCLRALEVESPAVLHEADYDYRLHGANTIKEALEKSKVETIEMLVAWGQNNIQMPQDAALRNRLIACARDCAFLKAGHGHQIDRKHLIGLAHRLLAKDGVGT